MSNQTGGETKHGMQKTRKKDKEQRNWQRAWS